MMCFRTSGGAGGAAPVRMRRRSAAERGLRRCARGGGAVPVQGTAPPARAAAEGARGGAPPLGGDEGHDYAAEAELNPQTAWTATPDGRLDHVNRRWGEWTGTATGTAGLGRGWAAGLHPGDRARTIAAWRRSVATGEPYDVEHRVRMRDGAFRWMHSRARPRRDGEGRVAKWYGTTEDIHDRKAAEEALRASEERLRAAKDAAGLGVWEWDLASRTARWSERTFRLWGLAPPAGGGEGTLPDSAVLAAVHPDDRGRVGRELGAAAAARAAFRSEFRVGAGDGAVRWLSGHGRWLDGAGGSGGSAGRMVGVCMDVTERRRAEDGLRLLNATLEERVERRTRELAEAQAALFQAQKMEAVGQLTGGIAHDFNNLLQVVTGNLEMARRSVAGGDEPRAQRQLDNALKGARRAAVLTQRLLAFSRRQPLAPEAVDVDALVAGMAADLLARTLGGAVAFEADPAPGLWPATADPHQLENALLNLAVNARDAMAGCADARLAIRTANVVLDAARAGAAQVSPGRYVEVSVADTGAGMPPEVLARAFEPFFTTKEVGKGTGLGLSMVFGFMKQSGGAVLVDTAVGRGTTVRLLLPAAGADAAAAATDPPGTEARQAAPLGGAPRPRRPAAGGDGEPATVLLVEDQDEVGDLAQAILADAGYRVLRASCGPDALAALAGDGGRDVSLLFSDVMMPGGMSGLDLAREALLRRPGLPVLLTTGHAQAALDLRRCGGEGGGSGESEFPVLDKPYRRGELLAEVRAALVGRECLA